MVLEHCYSIQGGIQAKEFGNRILRRIFGPKRDENGEWRRLPSEELHSLYCSSNIIRVITSRRLRWAGNVARIEEGRSAFKILTVKPTAKKSLESPGIDVRTTLEWILKKIGVNTKNWIDSAQYRDYWRVLCELSIEYHCSISHEVSLLIA